MSKILLAGITILLVFVSAREVYSQNYNRKMTNNKTHEEILVGLCTRSAFLEDSYQDWFIPKYKTYKVASDKAVIDSLKPLLKDLKIKIVLGTWCHDSQEQLPHFFSILDYLHFPEENYTIIGVNTQKEAVSFSIEDLDVVLVPTFIFYKKEQEIGRIIESPIISLEKDMLHILRKAETD
ncbi:MAG: thioredoxin [Bacteroidetes bacterium]|nr:thioredoxin [Bacteroidota bacterium]